MNKNYLFKNLLFSLILSVNLQLKAGAEENQPVENEIVNSASEKDMSLEDLLNIEVVSASQQSEPLKETPVPVTVITSDMIQKIGAKNLKDVLVTYVPGMTFSQDHNEINIAMRGIYASSQQKILIMQDGHRLNSRAYSSANPDYSISLEKIKQIEILRGPASSLYGNVALTAVVNLVTKKGKDLNGADVIAGIGNYGQRKLSFVYGDEFKENNDLVLWGNYYYADGQKVLITKENDFSDKPQDGYALLDGIKDKPSYELGLKYNIGDFSLFADSRYGHYIEPFTGGGDTGENYEYDKYRTLFGVGPGLGSQFTNLGFTYQKDLGSDFNFSFNGYNDYNDIAGTIVTDPSTQGFSFINWNEYDLGFISQLSKSYKTASFGEGSGLFGIQVDSMNLYDSSFPAGAGGDFTKFSDTKAKRLLELGSENIYSAFAQVKHKLRNDLIFNLGLRYDEKQRHQGENVRDLSPRLAVIYLPSENFEVKASFSQSFVDAPYWYRYNSLASYSGSKDLKPEHLKSFQLSPTIRLFNNHFTNTLNLFYNDLNDFIYRDPKAAATAPKYRNAGSLKSYGIEEEIAYIESFYTIRGNFTFQKVIEAKDYPVTGSDINNVPALTGNLILDINPLFWLYDKVNLDLNARFIGSQSSPLVNINKNGKPFNDPGNTISPVLLLNAGLTVTEPWLNKIAFDARVYNLLDTQYSAGGSVPHPYIQPGRWFMFNLSYHL